MFTPRHIILAARLFFVFAAVGMAVLLIGPFQGLERVVGLDDKAAHLVAFYGVTLGLLVIAPRQRGDDLALFAIAAALGVEILQAFTGRSVSIMDFLAGAAGVVAAWLPGRIAQLRYVARHHPDRPFDQIAAVDRRIGRARKRRAPTIPATPRA